MFIEFILFIYVTKKLRERETWQTRLLRQKVTGRADASLLAC